MLWTNNPPRRTISFCIRWFKYAQWGSLKHLNSILFSNAIQFMIDVWTLNMILHYHKSNLHQKLNLSQCSSVMVSRKKMYKICHYTHHFIWCFAHWNLVSNKYFNYALLSNCNFSDFQYWNLDQNESLRGKKAVFCVSCPNCTSQNLKIEFCITTCDVTKNFY